MAIAFIVIGLVFLGAVVFAIKLGIDKSAIAHECQTLEVKLKASNQWAATSKEEAAKAWRQYNAAMTRIECLETRGAQIEAELAKRIKLDEEFERNPHPSKPTTLQLFSEGAD